MAEDREFNYEQDLAIDPHSLDEEWLRQPGLYMKYCEAAVEAEKIRDKAKERVSVVKAELDREIRKDPAKFGLEKMTEPMVAGSILLQARYTEAASALVEADFKFNIIQSAVRALDHKRSALENEVKLWLGSYFSGPKTPRDIPGGKRIIDMARDNISSRAREEGNRRLRESANGKSEDAPVRRRRES